jgi:hypothetical protein
MNLETSQVQLMWRRLLRKKPFPLTIFATTIWPQIHTRPVHPETVIFFSQRRNSVKQSAIVRYAALAMMTLLALPSCRTAGVQQESSETQSVSAKQAQGGSAIAVGQFFFVHGETGTLCLIETNEQTGVRTPTGYRFSKLGPGLAIAGAAISIGNFTIEGHSNSDSFEGLYQSTVQGVSATIVGMTVINLFREDRSANLTISANSVGLAALGTASRLWLTKMPADMVKERCHPN